MTDQKRELTTETVPEEAWRKSSFSGGGSGGDCVEVATLRGGRAFRDSKNPRGGELRLSEESATAFLASLKS